MSRDAVQELLRAPYGHKVWLDVHRGEHHVMLDLGGGRSVHEIAHTFDEAVLSALDKAITPAPAPAGGAR